MAAHQAPPSLGFSRQEHWSGLPFPSPMHERENWKWSLSVVSDPQRPHGLQPTRLFHPWDFPGRVLEWGAIASPSAYFIYVVFIFPQNRLFFFIILNNQGSLRFTHMLCHFPSSSFLLEAHFFLCELISFFSVSCFQHLNFWVPRFGWWFGVLRLKSMPCYANLFHSLVSDSK